MNVISVLFLGFLQSGQAMSTEIVEDVALVWESVELIASSTALGDVRVRAAVRTGKGSFVLDRLDVSTQAGKVACDKRFFSDLSFPNVSSIQLIIHGEPAPDTKEFGIRFSFGDEALEGRYPHVTIDVKDLECVAREFGLPNEDGGTNFQAEPPPQPHWRFR